MAEIFRLFDNTYRIEDSGVRFFLLVGNEKAILIDSGMNTKNAKELAEGLTNLPLSLVNTLSDPDHVSGNAAFESFYMTESDYEYYVKNGGRGKC
ncbi:MAG: MBL fold metallo-hydrolase, partial [Clostridiales bacterium]|nr:MBL fold metallo-hydrolase [Candidatus Coliplasma equi]